MKEAGSRIPGPWLARACAALLLALPAPRVGAQSGSWILPSSVHRTGANGAEYHSDVRILNQGSSAVTVTAVFHDQVTGQTLAAPPFLVAARSQAAFDNVLQSLFGRSLSLGSYGPLRFQASAPIVVSSSVNNVNACGTGAVSGQWLPGIDATQGLTAGTIGHLGVSPSSLTGYRTNVVFTNPGSSPALVSATVRTGAGAKLASGSIGPLAANGFAQVALDSSAVFPGVAGTTNSNLWLEFVSDQPVLAFASVINNASGDPFAVLATTDSNPQPVTSELVGVALQGAGGGQGYFPLSLRPASGQVWHGACGSTGTVTNPDPASYVVEFPGCGIYRATCTQQNGTMVCSGNQTAWNGGSSAPITYWLAGFPTHTGSRAGELVGVAYQASGGGQGYWPLSLDPSTGQVWHGACGSTGTVTGGSLGAYVVQFPGCGTYRAVCTLQNDTMECDGYQTAWDGSSTTSLTYRLARYPTHD